MRLFVKESAQGVRMTGPDEVVKSVQPLKNSDQEVMIVIGFNSKNREIFREVVFKGGMSACNVDMKTLFRHLLLKGCDGFVMIHNHPSEDPNPSVHDARLTEYVAKGSRVVDIRFHDHIIIGGDTFYSFKTEQPHLFDPSRPA